jgi:hypothetical protein
MNYSTAIMIVNDSIRAIRCAYEPTQEGTKSYLFKTLDPNIKNGDLVVVPSTTRYKRAVVKVIEVDVEPDFDSDVQVEWIVGRIDNADYSAIKKAEQEFIDKSRAAEKKAKRDELRKKWDALDSDTMKNLAISNMTALPNATPQDHSAEGAQATPPFTYKTPPSLNTSDVEF